MTPKIDLALSLEAKAIVALAFRNGFIEELHAGKTCPVCNGNSEYSRTSDEEMKKIMKSAVNKVYSLLWERVNDSSAYLKSAAFGLRYAEHWDDPEV
jgi:hypothetical protein